MFQDVVAQFYIIPVMGINGVGNAVIFIDTVRPVLFVLAINTPSACTRAFSPLRLSADTAPFQDLTLTGSTVPSRSLTLSTV